VKVKTNVTRLLDAAKIPYEVLSYEVDEADLSGVHAASLLNMPGFSSEQVFKTLVLRGASGAYFVCCIPVAENVDLKKAAKVMEEKSADLIAVKELLPLTGYVRGGCSPMGMKKTFPILVDETATLFDRISVSAGLRGALVLLAPQALITYINARLCDLTVVG
jgi:Cys-tRNA(Pro)/Cys-tRNA(Cys) deacylase